jgi:hypothetical protein
MSDVESNSADEHTLENMEDELEGGSELNYKDSDSDSDQLDGDKGGLEVGGDLDTVE